MRAYKRENIWVRLGDMIGGMVELSLMFIYAIPLTAVFCVKEFGLRFLYFLIILLGVCYALGVKLIIGDNVIPL